MEGSEVRRRGGGADEDEDAEPEELDRLIKNNHEEDADEEAERRRKLNMGRIENIALPVFYFMLGFNLKLPFVAQRQYLRRVLKASPANQALVLNIIAQIPWQLKLFYAFLSDTVPIGGRRRKPYMIIGVILFTIAWITLGLIRPAPKVGTTAFLLFAGTFGMIMTDVMADTIVVEKVALERGKEIGSLLTYVWVLRFAGSFFGMFFGGYLLQYAKLSEQNIFFLQGLTQIIMVMPFLVRLEDQMVTVQQSVAKQLSDIWVTITDKRVSWLIYFMFIFGCTPNAGSAFTNYLLGPLKFTDAQYMYLNLVGILFAGVGSYIYKMWFRNSNLRVFVFLIVIVGAALQLVPLILISRVNLTWGISDFWFSIGDELIVELVSIMVVMPMLIVCAKVSPANVEGTVYSFLTMSSNISMAIGEAFSAMLTAYLGISVTKFTNLKTLIIISAACSLLPLFFLWLLPWRIETTQRIKIGSGLEEKYKTKCTGIASIALVVGGLVFTIVQSIVKITSNNK